MIMKRKAYSQLLEWKRFNNGKTAMLVEGARRIGKSYIIEQFAKNEYESYLIIDFNQAKDGVKALFDDYLSDIDQLLFRLQVYYGKTLIARNSEDDIAHSVIIFDEVQFCPKARSAIKYLVADHRFDYIESGSLISIKKNVKDIMIPSEEESMNMFPMDFEEFLWALGDEMTMPFIKRQFERKEPMGLLHRKVMDLFRQYLIVGGMPQAVAEFVKSKDFLAVDKIKRSILKLYKNDINKYADRQETRVSAIFEEIPSQLQKHEKRFQLSSLQSQARLRDYESAFLWLKEAGIINCCYNSTEPTIGLQLNVERTTLKCYMNDTGLLISHAFDTNDKVLSSELYRKLLQGTLEINEGMLTENIVAQMLRASGHKLFFFSKSSKIDNTERMEIDFLVPKHSITNRHNISPIEVKSGQRYTYSSLNKFTKKYNAQLSTAYILHDKDLKVEDGIVFLPLYMTPLL